MNCSIFPDQYPLTKLMVSVFLCRLCVHLWLCRGKKFWFLIITIYLCWLLFLFDVYAANRHISHFNMLLLCHRENASPSDRVCFLTHHISFGYYQQFLCQGGGMSCDLPVVLVSPGGLKAVITDRKNVVLQCDRKQDSSSGVLRPCY